MSGNTRILVTGGAGYIGTTLIPLLLRRGYDVTVLDNLMFGGQQLLPFFRHRNFSFMKGDVRNRSTMAEASRSVDIIIHLAAIVGLPACQSNPGLAKTVNVDGAKTLASVASPRQFVLVGSTGSNYGAVKNGVCTEETPLRPLSLYGKTKTQAERMLMDKTNCTAFRFATAFGVSPRLRLDLLINDLTYKALTDRYLVIYEPEFMRTFIHVQDMVRSFVFAIENYAKMRNKVFNVGDERLNASKRDVVEMIASKTGAYVHYADVDKDQDKRDYVVSYKKISGLGFRTTIGIENGIDELVRAMNVVTIPNPHKNAS